MKSKSIEEMYQDIIQRHERIKQSVGKTYRLRKENEKLVEERTNKFKEKYPLAEANKIDLLNLITKENIEKITDEEIMKELHEKIK